MAGMLPGVEAARRRRFHKSNFANSEISLTPTGSFTRRSSFCLYASSHEFHFSSTSSLQRSQQQGMCDERGLDAAAREAKKRLDDRLLTHRRSNTNIRTLSSQQRTRSVEERPIHEADVLTEAYKLKKNGYKRLNWLKLNWKSSEQEECTVCLELFKGTQGADTLMQLPCAHKFHTKCLVPWLEGNSHCPCCRMEIHSSI